MHSYLKFHQEPFLACLKEIKLYLRAIGMIFQIQGAPEDYSIKPHAIFIGAGIFFMKRNGSLCFSLIFIMRFFNSVL